MKISRLIRGLAIACLRPSSYQRMGYQRISNGSTDGTTDKERISGNKEGNMRKYCLIVLLLWFICGVSYSEEQGELKLSLPVEKCKVNIDGMDYMADSSVFSKAIPIGKHVVTVYLLDEDTSVAYEEVIIATNEATLITVPLKEKGVGMGFAAGMDNATLLSSAYGDNSVPYNTMSPQFDVSWFYSAPIKKHIYFDLDISLYRSPAVIQDNADRKELLAVFPVKVSLKGKVNKDLIIGWGINYSAWIFNEKIGEAFHYNLGGPGFQVFAEIIPISTEIGFMVKTLKREYLHDVVDYSSSGLYIKYKLYI